MALDAKISDLVLTVFEAIQDVKGQDIIGIDLSESQTYTDFVFVVSAGSNRQSVAITDQILEKAFAKCQRNPLGVEGYDQAEWVLVDFGDVVIHVFLEEVRDKYRLEDMWMQLPSISEEGFEESVRKLTNSDAKLQSV